MHPERASGARVGLKAMKECTVVFSLFSQTRFCLGLLNKGSTTHQGSTHPGARHHPLLLPAGGIPAPEPRISDDLAEWAGAGGEGGGGGGPCRTPAGGEVGLKGIR